MLTGSISYILYHVDGFPCPITGNSDNFTLAAGYPNPLWTKNTHAFNFLCNGGRGSPFDWQMGIPGPGRALNPWNVECKVEKQGLPVNFNQEIIGFECRGESIFLKIL